VEVKAEGDVCAVVGGKQITVKELRAKLNTLFGRDVVQSLITKRIMAAEAARIGLVNTDEEIRAMAAQMTDDRLTELKQMLAYQYPMTPDADALLKSYIKDQTGQTLEEHTKQSIDDLVKSGDAVNNLTLAKLVTHYLLTTERVTVQQAVFPDEYSAKDTWAKLRQGADFTKLARANGGQASEDDGVLASFSRAEYDMRPDLRVAGKNLVNVAFATKSGRFSGVFQCKDGWRIIRIIDYQPASDLTYSALKERIRDEVAKNRQWMMYVPLWARMKALEKGVAIKLPA
jgi:parvulin-like peptidyl-prolyl isomerase